MRSLRAVALVGMALSLALFAAPAASASVEVGSDCEASGMVVGATLFPLVASPDNQLPISPTTGGIATKWKVRSPGSDVHTEKLKIFRPEFGSNQVRVVAESDLQGVTDGHETFDIRIPVQAGDRFGVTGKVGEGAIACIPSRPGDVAGAFFEESQPGSAYSFGEYNSAQAAVSVVMEPDRDGDGYGDETQDGCPQSAAYHGLCPTITLEAFPIVLKRSVLVLVSASSTSSVHVFGQTSWRLKPKPRHATSSKKHVLVPTTGLIVGLTGGTQTVNAGELARFNVKLPKSVKRRLGRISPSESLKASITASTVDLAGRTSTKVLTVRLPGQDRSG